jgi:hypothetical protein
VREEAISARETGDYGAASGRIEDLMTEMRAFAAQDAELLEQIEELELTADQLSTGTMSAPDAKYLYLQSYASATQRRQNARAICRVKPKAAEDPERE